MKHDMKGKKTRRYGDKQLRNLSNDNSSMQKKGKIRRKCDVKSSNSNGKNNVKLVSSWDSFLTLPSNWTSVAPVSFFKHAPLADIWDQYSTEAIGRSIEIPNIFVDAGDTRVNWVANVKKFVGYKALVEYVTFGVGPKRYAWISFCSSLPRPLGFSTLSKILLCPTLDVAHAIPNFMQKLQETVTTRTVSEEHGIYLRQKIKDINKRYPIKSKVEALDRTYISRVRVATVTGIIGDRIHVTYDVEPIPNDDGFVFSVHSDYVHAIGWAKEVGQEIFDPIEPSVPFPLESLPSYPPEIILKKGQVLEARHPLDPFVISEAYVETVLNHGYMMISFVSVPAELRRKTRYCVHITSPYIFPSGFCRRNNITLRETLRKKISEMFEPAPLHLLPTRPKHKFKIGFKLESIDECDPSFLGAVTIVKIAEHLLLLHYDGWDVKVPKNTIWMSSDSGDIFPAGYAELIGHKMKGPPSNSIIPSIISESL